MIPDITWRQTLTALMRVPQAHNESSPSAFAQAHVKINDKRKLHVGEGGFLRLLHGLVPGCIHIIPCLYQFFKVTFNAFVICTCLGIAWLIIILIVLKLDIWVQFITLIILIIPNLRIVPKANMSGTSNN